MVLNPDWLEQPFCDELGYGTGNTKEHGMSSHGPGYFGCVHAAG